MKISPLAPEKFPDLGHIPGVRLAAAAAGVKYSGRTDVTLVELCDSSSIAGVFTQSLTASAPVEWCRSILKGGRARAILINSGNANAFTGKAGESDVDIMVRSVAKALQCPENEIFVASTGVIGEPLPVHRIKNVVPALRRNLSEHDWQPSAEAIMTTDTFPKGATVKVNLNGTIVSISGFAKGSGMIAPDMATMLAFAFTDAKIPAELLQKLLQKAANKTFNCITVDGDTSTSDTLMLAATGQSDHAPVSSMKQLHSFYLGLEKVLYQLATQVVRDGEGAKKFITIDVSGAASTRAARKIGLSIANSPLVKTAIAGEDANWGRVVMAVGKAGEKADRDALVIAMGGVVICENGSQREDFDESRIAEHLSGTEISISVDIGVGKGKATVWTCDLTHDYISINADYRS